MMSLVANKPLKYHFLVIALVLITTKSWAYTYGNQARGELSKSIKTTAEIYQDTGELDSSVAKIEYSYTELKSLGLVVIYNPELNVLPWAPTTIKQFEMDFEATDSNQKTLCGTLGYTHSVTEDLKTQNDGYTGRDLTAKIQKGSRVIADLDGNLIRLQAVSKRAGGSATKHKPVIKRLVCVK
jgi:hypothetical protein